MLTKINETSSSMEDGLKCFDEAKTDAQNASQTAQLAYNISKDAKQVSSFILRTFYVRLLLFSPIFVSFPIS